MKFKRILFIILAALITLLFISTRLYNFANRFGFDHDQEEAANAAWRIVVEKKPMLIGQETSIGGLFVGPLLFWFQSLAMYLGHLNPLSLGYLGIAVSFITLIVLFIVVSEISNKWQAVIAVFLYAISARLTGYDISSHSLTYIMLFSLLIFWLLFKIITKKQSKLLPLLALVLSLTFHIHLALALLIPPTLLLLLLKRPKIKVKHLILALVTFILPLLTFVLFELRHKFLLTNNLLIFLGNTRGFSASHILQTVNTFMVLLVESVFIKSRYSILIFVVIVSIFIYLMKKPKKESKNLILTMLFLPLSFFLFYKGPIPEYYFLPVVPIFIIAASYVYFYLARKSKVAFILIIAIVAFYNIAIAKILSVGRGFAPYTLKEYVVRSIISDTKGETFNVYYKMPPGYNNGYQYLFKWQGRQPQEGGKNLYIIELVAPNNFDPTQQYKAFPNRAIRAWHHGFLHIISVK